MAKKHKELIKKALNVLGRPLQAVEIHKYIEKQGIDLKLTTLRVVLNISENEGILETVKYDGLSKFYCKPEWVDEGKCILIDFDPHWNKKQRVAP